MPTVSSLPASLMRTALLPALILAATQAGAADSASTQRLDSAIMSSHGLVESTADEATASTQDSSQGDAASAQASRASTSSTGNDSADASLADPLPINRGGQPADARAELENQRRQAQAALNRRDPARALAMANAALQEAPGDARLRFLKGLALFQLKRMADAEHEFNGLIEEFPELPEPYNNLAVVRAAQGNLEGARDALEAAIRSVPDYAVAYQNLGDLYLQLAAQRWRHAQKLAPSPVRATRLKALETLLEPSTDRSSGEASRSVTRPAESAVRRAPAGESTTPRRSSPTE
ncbi:MAG: tetratricopeptide repeat protein [Lautropia mirabilis]|nr:tetratricopeptide repeat protein [Lautropia mirabilis]